MGWWMELPEAAVVDEFSSFLIPSKTPRGSGP